MFNIIKEYIRQSKVIEEDREFNNLYNELEEIQAIEEKRNKSLLKIIKLYAITIFISLMLIFIRQKIYFSPLINLIFIVTIAIIIFKSISDFLNDKEEYKNYYKTNILMKVIRKINKNTNYLSKERNEY